MTVDELLRALSDAFPQFNTKALASWSGVYRHSLAGFEGHKLARAHHDVMASFRPSGRTPFPVPAEYLAALPDAHRDAQKAAAQGGPTLDVRGHRDRVRALVADWRLRQGNAFCRGVPEVLRSIADLATERADLMAWRADAGPLVLSAEELRFGLHRAISLARRDRYGNVGNTPPDLWWQQVTDVAYAWGFEARRDDWHGAGFKALLDARMAIGKASEAQDAPYLDEPVGM